MQGHRSACEAAPVLFADVRLALIHERCFILLSGLRSERLLILDFAWVSVRMGIGRSGAVHPARPCHRHRHREPDTDVFVQSAHIQRRQP